MEPLTLTTFDGFTLDALYHKGTNNIGIVFCHGLSWFKEREEPFMRAAEKLASLGFSPLLFDFRGHGKSSGTSEKDFFISSQLKDIDAACTYLKSQGVKKYYLAGASFGGGAAALYGAKHKDMISKLLLLNPTIDYESSMRKHFTPQMQQLKKKGYIESGSRKLKLGKKLFQELQEFFPYKVWTDYTNDLLIIHGDQDTRIPVKGVLEHFETLKNSNKKFSLIIGAEHGFHEEPFTSQVTEIIVEFFKNP